ncbi:hypothetical protein V8E53_006780 [Lactarius tabidus]
MEARHERAVRLRLVSKHQNEWEEFGVLNAGDGHASGAKGSRDGDRTRDQGGARTRRLRSSQGLRKRLVLKKTTLRMRTMLLLPAPPTSAGVCVLLLYSTSSGYKKGKEGAGGPGSGPFVKDAVDEAPFGSEGVMCWREKHVPWATVRAVRVNAATWRSKGDMSGRVGGVPVVLCVRTGPVGETFDAASMKSLAACNTITYAAFIEQTNCLFTLSTSQYMRTLMSVGDARGVWESDSAKKTGVVLIGSQLQKSSASFRWVNILWHRAIDIDFYSRRACLARCVGKYVQDVRLKGMLSIRVRLWTGILGWCYIVEHEW